MKFHRIGLERYGRFTDRQIELDPTARLVVIEGANEAGKTTALAAVTDLLFGIGGQSPFNFLHDYKSMRLSATISDGAGRTLSFARLKRRHNTLVQPEDDTPLPDDALAPFLGAHDRKAFLDIFGLDQYRLRAGGKELLAGGGDLAETLLAAAPGLAPVAELRDQMSASAGAVFSPARRSSNHLFYQALNRRKEALDLIKAQELRADEVKKLRTEAQEAHAARGEAVAAEIDARIAVERADMLRRAARELRLVTAKEQALAQLGPLPALGHDSVQQARTLLAGWQEAQEEARHAAHEHEQARALRATICVDDAILALEDTIERCAEEDAAMRDKHNALPNRRREVETARAALARIAAGLGLATLEKLREKLPARPQLVRATQLADRLSRHATLRQALAKDRAELEHLRHQLEAARREKGDVADPTPLSHRLEQLDGAEARETSLRELAHHLRAARESLAARLARLPFGPRDLAALDAMPLPDMASTEARLKALQDADEAQARAQAQLHELAAEKARLIAHLEALNAGGPAPTPSAITEARTTRDTLWADLRPLATGTRPARPEDAAQAQAFDSALIIADRLADDRQTETRRLSDLARATSDLADIEARITTGHETLNRAARQQAEALAVWHALWAPAGLDPAGEPQALTMLRDVEAARRERETLRQNEVQAQTLAEARQQDRAEADTLRTALGLAPLGDAPLRMAELRAAIRAREDAFRTVRDTQRDLQGLERQGADLARREGELAPERATLEAEMTEVFPALSIRPGASVDEARAAINLWQEALSEHDKLSIAERRIAGIERDAESFATHVEQLLQQAGLGDFEGDASAAIRHLRERLFTAREARSRARDADTALEARTQIHAQAQARQQQALAALEPHLTASSVAQPAALPSWLERMEQAMELRHQRAEALERLDESRGDRTLDTLRTAIGGKDDEALARDMANAAAAHEEARTTFLRAVERDSQAHIALEALDQREGAATAAQMAQDAEAELTEAAERFIRDHIAARLMTLAVERYREAHQSPILTRASAAFHSLTCGRWDGIGVDYDAPVPRLAARREGQLLGFDALSEGTADQLFLALRVAAIEEHARRATPLPFLADDLFVSFDEKRTMAGLRLLAELGKQTQVIIFTHHRHVTACAQQALPGQVCVIPL
ncbi:AAA family ATPase [Xanthobacter sp. TB0139]|uniref:AAA family ATPase n=1 Tax=Xanthobacter sp. TB0139 TaxID=3459178 RepID=UPI0040399997